MSTAGSTLLTGRDTGPGPEREVARDLARRAVPATPVFVGAAALGWGLDGALSAAFGIVLVVANFLLAASLIGWAARVSFAALAGTAMFGYLVRLTLVFATVTLVADAGWVERVPLGLTLVVTHLGLLFWEVRYVSASLAHPGLVPDTKEPSR